MANYTVFYGTQVVGEYANTKEMKLDIPVDGDIYQGGYCYLGAAHNHEWAVRGPGWYRIDMTPVLLEDVPKQLRTMALLLNL